MPRQRVDWFPIILGSLFLFVILVPYILAYNAGGEAYRFGGFLLNPLDGNSFQTRALNVPVRDGDITKVELLLTRDADINGLPEHPEVLYTRS